jgi:hypothetical protein
MRDRVPLLAGLTILSIAFVVGSLLIAGGIRDRGKTDVITVTGSAKARITSDYIVWDASLTSRGKSPQTAAAQLAGWSKRARAFFDSQGVAAGELTVQPIATESPGSIDENGDKVTDYRLTRSFEIRSSRVDAIAQLAERSSSLLAQGIPLAADPPQYVYTKLPSLRPRLLAAATKDAQQRARVLVDSSGAKLGTLRGVNVGVFQVSSPNSTDVSDYGVYDTTTLTKDVTAVVNVTFALS